ncbi:MAG TPA: hypothetical protein VHY08_05050 [Bacillota bacterium]|nr:hypothetical protein [Bacillota bacterium]
MATKDSGSKSKNKRGLIITFLVIILLAGVAGGWLMLKKDSGKPEPLSLAPGEAVWGRIGVETPGPFTIGDRIPVFIEIEAKTAVKYEFPDLAKTPLGSLEIVNISPKKEDSFPEGYRSTVQYLITGWQVGHSPLPALTLNYQDSAGKSGTYQIPGMDLNLVSVLPSKKTTEELLKLDIKGAKRPLGFPPRYPFLYWYLLGSLIAAIIFWRWTVAAKKRRNQALAPEPELPPEPAHIIALRRLEALKNSVCNDDEQFLAFYTELSECIREYMENRFQINALEMTTEEFLGYVTKKSDCLSKAQQTVLKEFLMLSDLVKFAKQRPAPEAISRALTDIERIVEETKEIESEGERVAS